MKKMSVNAMQTTLEWPLVGSIFEVVPHRSYNSVMWRTKSSMPPHLSGTLILGTDQCLFAIPAKRRNG